MLYSLYSGCDYSAASASGPCSSTHGPAPGPPILAAFGTCTAGTAATAGAPSTETEAADPAADPHC